MAESNNDHIHQHWMQMKNVIIQHPHEYNGVDYRPGNPQQEYRGGAYNYNPQLSRSQNFITENRIGHRQQENWNQSPQALNQSSIYEDETSENYGSEIADSWRPIKIKPPNHVRNSGHWRNSKSQEILNYPTRHSPRQQIRESPGVSDLQSPTSESAFHTTNLPGFSADMQSDDEEDDDDEFSEQTNSQEMLPNEQSVRLEERQKLNVSNNEPKFKNNPKYRNKKRKNTYTVSSEEDFEYHSTSEPIGDKDDINHNPKKKKRLRKISQERLLEQYPNEGGSCQTCMSRVPFATLIATVMCCIGVGVFCGTMYRGSTLTLRMFEDVFKLKVKWVEPVQLTFMIVGAGMGGLGLMILFVGCLSTGDTRAKVYRTWRGRVGGRISCAVLMTVAYILTLAWLMILCFLMFVTLLYSLAWLQCLHIPENECIDYNQFGFLFPAGTQEEDKRVCTGEKKIFCKDYVNNAEVMFILATIFSFLVILSLIHYLMCLAANYAHIKNQEKFMELSDLQHMQFLNESEMSTLPKDRF